LKHRIKEHPERFFIGIEYEGGITSDMISQIPTLWESFMSDIQLLKEEPLKQKFVGLECYPPDFMETKVMDYYAMVETTSLIEHDGFVSKRLPAGRYIEFDVQFDQLHDDMQRVYQYLKDENMAVHTTFDYEDYLAEENYSEPGAMLRFCFLLNDE
jgi:hypothetical protein